MWGTTVVRKHAESISESNQYHVYYLQMCMKLITYVTTKCWQNVIVLHIATYFIRHIFVASDHAAIQKTCAQTIKQNATETAKTNNQKKTTT